MSCPSLPLKVARPCPVSWEAMPGTSRVRFCAVCRKCVYNLSELKAEEAEALVLEKEGQLCVRFYERDDGTVMTSDCAFGLALASRKMGRLLRRLATATLGLVGLMLGNLAFADNWLRWLGAPAMMGALANTGIPPVTANPTTKSLARSKGHR